MKEVARGFGRDATAEFCGAIAEFVAGGLLEHEGERIRLTERGRLLSNEVFERFVSDPAPLAS